MFLLTSSSPLDIPGFVLSLSSSSSLLIFGRWFPWIKTHNSILQFLFYLALVICVSELSVFSFFPFQLLIGFKVANLICWKYWMVNGNLKLYFIWSMSGNWIGKLLPDSFGSLENKTIQKWDFVFFIGGVYLKSKSLFWFLNGAVPKSGLIYSRKFRAFDFT